MMSGLVLKRLLAAFLVVLVFGVLYQIFWYGRVSVSAPEGFTAIKIGEQTITVPGSFRMRPGTYSVTAVGPLMKPQQINVGVAPFGSKTINLADTTMSREELIEEVVQQGLRPGFSAGKTVVLENDTWIVSYIYDVLGNREGYANIYRFEETAWQLFDSGTGFVLDGYNDTGMPASVIRYLSTGVEQ